MIEQILMLIMMVDFKDDFWISYMNLIMMDLVGVIFDYIKVLVDQLMGMLIDVFYVNLDYQWCMLFDLLNLLIKVCILFVGWWFFLKVFVICDGVGNYVGLMVVWDDIMEWEKLVEFVGVSVDEVVDVVEKV